MAVPFVACAAWHVAFVVALLYQPAWLSALTSFMPFVILVNLAGVAVALVSAAVAYRRLPNVAARRRLRWIVVGSTFGCVAGVPIVASLWIGIVDDPTLAYRAPLGLQLAYSAFLVMPVAFWWAIARRQLFDIGFVIRRGLQYLFARHALLVLTPATVAALALDAALHSDHSLQQLLSRHGVLYATAAILLVLFRLRRDTWLDTLDRRLFRERYDAARLLRDVATELRTTRDLGTATTFAVAQIEAALHPLWIAAYAAAPSDSELTLIAGSSIGHSWPRASTLLERERGNHAPLDVPVEGTAAWKLLPERERLMLVRTGARLVVPILGDPEGAEAMLVLGPKRSGEPYGQEDKTLLQAIATSIGALALAARGGSDQPAVGSSWDRTLWTVAETLVTGRRVDWQHEWAAADTERQRQTLIELQALDRLMQLHGVAAYSSDASDDDLLSAPKPRRWGAFELRGVIGVGRFGTVHRGWDPTLEREVAIKLLDVAGVDRAACLHEARRLARVHHPNVVQVYGADVIDEVPGFWMELLEGETLAESLHVRGRFDDGEVQRVADALCRALSAIHRAGLVHQDVKAENVVQDAEGRLVLMDLGAALGGADRPRWGTPRYMAPELFDGGGASPQSDLYSLAVLLFVLLTGKFPVPGATYEEIARHHAAAGGARPVDEFRSGVRPSLRRAVERGLATSPALRFESAARFLEAMHAEPS
ncbi:MAG: protein kinase domain-containing protein [Acidobacteriota bacterium]